MLVEVCANSLESAMNAQKAGADRIELCSELAIGGITPSFGLMKSVKENIEIPVHVLIRPRSGDFTYSEMEFNIMKENIDLCVALGFEGIVSGILHADFKLDVERTKTLIEASGDLKFTFHRAFDWVLNPIDTLKHLERLGVDTILSSGQQKSAFEGIGLLSQLNEMATTCTIMPGGGINERNAKQFNDVGFGAIHLSGIKYAKLLDAVPPVSMNSPSLLSDQGIYISNLKSLKNVLQEVK